MKFNFGFEYINVRYGWKDKKLFRLPFERNLKTFGLKEIKPIRNGMVYNIQRTQKTIANLKLMTKKVDWKVDVIESKDCP